jgi:hypothetical protein
MVCFCCAAFNIAYHVFPQDIAIRPNMSSGEWMDGDEAVSSGTMEVQLAATGDPDFDDHFLVTLDELKVGAAIRWAITIGNSGDMHISLHGLPLSKEAVLAKPSLRGDNVPVIQLFSVPIHCRVFDGQRAAGPVPLICVTSQEEAAFVRASPAFVHAELQKLAACYLKPEFISRQDALGIYPLPLHCCYASSIHFPARPPGLQP